jgi:hypothetical protein
MNSRVLAVALAIVVGAGATPRPGPGVSTASGATVRPVSARPLVEQILRAHGGRAALARVTGYRMEGRIDAVRPGRRGPTRRLWQRPGNLRVELWYPGADEIRVVRGREGWRCSGGDCGRASGPMLDAMILQAARAGAPWVLMERAARARAVAPMEFRGRRLPGVEIALGDGLTLQLYADPATHRIVVSRGVLEHGGVKTPFATNFSDYRAVGSVWFAFAEENFASGAHTGDTTIESVELNPRLAPNDFTAPVGREGES